METCQQKNNTNQAKVGEKIKIKGKRKNFPFLFLITILRDKKTNKMNEIALKTFTTYCLSKEVEKQAKRLEYFTKHLQMCKNNTDKVKLSLLCALEIEMISRLIIQINKNNVEIIECL